MTISEATEIMENKERYTIPKCHEAAREVIVQYMHDVYKGEWTKCSKELPKEDGTYFIKTLSDFSDIEVEIGSAYFSSNLKVWYSKYFVIPDVIEWMKIPEQSEEDDK